MKCRTLISVTLLSCTMLVLARPAHAWNFYWSKVNVKSSSWQDCMSFANDAAQHEHLQQILHDRLEVKGFRNGNLATITCVATGGSSPAIAVVMVVGDAEGPVRDLRDALVSYVTRVQRID